MAFRMILHSEGERVTAHPRLLDNAVTARPRLDLESVGNILERLMMRAVHQRESMVRGRAVPERLDVGGLEIVMVRNIEMQRPAHRDVHHLQPPAYRQGRLSRRKDRRNGLELPRI